MNAVIASGEVVGVEEAARALGVEPVTVYRWCRSGRLRCRKLGKAWRIRRDDLEAAGGRPAPRTLTGHLGAFLAVPDRVLALAEDHELLRRLDAAFFRVGLDRDGLLAKLYDPAAVSRHAITGAMGRRGLDPGGLEAAGRLRWCPVRDPGEATGALAGLLGEAAGRPVWAALDAADLERTEAVVRAVAALGAPEEAGPLVTMTALVEPEPAAWPPLERQWAVLEGVRGTVRFSRTGLVLGRVLPAPED